MRRFFSTIGKKQLVCFGIGLSVLVPFFVFAAAITFTKTNIDTSFLGASDAVPIDFDLDGDIDIVAAGYTQGAVAWYRNNGSQTFTKINITTSLSAPFRLKVIDLDVDGDLDVIVAVYGQSDIVWYENDGSMSFAAVQTVDTNLTDVLDVEAADMSGDSEIDIVSVSRVLNTLVWYKNNGTETFTEINIDTTVNSTESIAIADFDGDGDKDIVSGDAAASDIFWYRNSGTGSFTKVTVSLVTGGRQFFAADIDEDGDQDFIATAGGESKTFWFRNSGTGSFTKFTLDASVASSNGIDVIDVDGDGDRDILSTALSDDDVLWYDNDGSENFTERTIDTSYGFPYQVYGSDVDRDGDIDVVVPSYNDSDIVWYLQPGSGGPDPTSFTPADGGYNISTTANLVIVFDEVAQGGTGTITIKKTSDNSTVETITANDASKVSGSGTMTITINPASTLATDTDYYILISGSSFRDAGGAYYAGIAATTTWNFSTTDTVAPTVSTLSPLDNATGINQTANLVLTFSEIVQGGTGTIIIKKTSDDSTIESIAANNATYVSGSGTTTITINPASTLVAYTEYYVTIHQNAFRDRAGNKYAGIAATTTWSFTTADLTNPTLSSFTPADNATGVSSTVNLVLNFSEIIQGGTGTLVVKKGSDNSVFETITTNNTTLVSGSGTTQVTVNLSGALTLNTAYYVIINKNAFQDAYSLDYAGFTTTTTWNFTTSATDTTKPLVVSLSPADNATNVSPTANLVITFDEAVQGGTGTVVIKKTSDNSTIETITTNNTGLVSGSGATQITINPASTLADSTSYYVIINKNAFQDSRSNDYQGFTATTTWDFTTADTTAPIVTTLSPADDATGVSPTANLLITFDEAVRGGTGSIFIKKSNDSSVVEQIAASGALVTGSGTTIITIDPSSALANSTSYYVTIETNAFEDISANNFAGISSTTTWNFTTVAAASAPATTSDSSGGGGGGGRGGGHRSTTVNSIEQTVKNSNSFTYPYSSGNQDGSSASNVNSNVDMVAIFDDVVHSDWYAPDIIKLKKLGVISGYKDDAGKDKKIYGPSDFVTYGQFAKMIGLLTAHSPLGKKATMHWAEPYVRSARSAGFSLYGPESLNLDHPIQRGAIAQTVLEAYGISLNARAHTPFTDLSATHPQASFLQTAFALGIMNGDDGATTIRPNDSINRAETAKILATMQERFIPVATNVFTSAPKSAPAIELKSPIRIVGSSTLNLRSDSRIDAAVVKELRKGQQVELLGVVHEKWAHVRLSDGREGYVWRESLMK